MTRARLVRKASAVATPESVGEKGLGQFRGVIAAAELTNDDLRGTPLEPLGHEFKGYSELAREVKLAKSGAPTNGRPRSALNNGEKGAAPAMLDEIKSVLITDPMARSDLQLEFLAEFIQDLEFFRPLPFDLITEIARRIRYKYAAKGTYLYRRGESASTMYILFDGTVEIDPHSGDAEAPMTPDNGANEGRASAPGTKNTNGRVASVAHSAALSVQGMTPPQLPHHLTGENSPRILLAGKHVFGDGALMEFRLRRRTVQAEDNCELMRLDKEAYKKAFSQWSTKLVPEPERVLDTLRKPVEDRTEEDLDFLLRQFSRLPFFSHLLEGSTKFLEEMEAVRADERLRSQAGTTAVASGNAPASLMKDESGGKRGRSLSPKDDRDATLSRPLIPYAVYFARRLVACMELVHLQPDTVLFKQGAVAKYFYFPLQGMVTLHRRDLQRSEEQQAGPAEEKLEISSGESPYSIRQPHDRPALESSRTDRNVISVSEICLLGDTLDILPTASTIHHLAETSEELLGEEGGILERHEPCEPLSRKARTATIASISKRERTPSSSSMSVNARVKNRLMSVALELPSPTSGRQRAHSAKSSPSALSPWARIISPMRSSGGSWDALGKSSVRRFHHLATAVSKGFVYCVRMNVQMYAAILMEELESGTDEEEIESQRQSAESAAASPANSGRSGGIDDREWTAVDSPSSSFRQAKRSDRDVDNLRKLLLKKDREDRLGLGGGSTQPPPSTPVNRYKEGAHVSKLLVSSMLFRLPQVSSFVYNVFKARGRIATAKSIMCPLSGKALKQTQFVEDFMSVAVPKLWCQLPHDKRLQLARCLRYVRLEKGMSLPRRCAVAVLSGSISLIAQEKIVQGGQKGSLTQRSPVTPSSAKMKSFSGSEGDMDNNGGPGEGVDDVLSALTFDDDDDEWAAMPLLESVELQRLLAGDLLSPSLMEMSLRDTTLALHKKVAQYNSRLRMKGGTTAEKLEAKARYVCTSSAATLAVIDGESYERIMEKFDEEVLNFTPERTELVLRTPSSQRSPLDEKFLQLLMADVLFLADLGHGRAKALLDAASYCEKEPGEVIYREGQEGQNIYVVLAGKVELLTSRPSHAEEVEKVVSDAAVEELNVIGRGAKDANRLVQRRMSVVSHVDHEEEAAPLKETHAPRAKSDSEAPSAAPANGDDNGKRGGREGRKGSLKRRTSFADGPTSAEREGGAVLLSDRKGDGAVAKKLFYGEEGSDQKVAATLYRGDAFGEPHFPAHLLRSHVDSDANGSQKEAGDEKDGSDNYEHTAVAKEWCQLLSIPYSLVRRILMELSDEELEHGGEQLGKLSQEQHNDSEEGGAKVERRWKKLKRLRLRLNLEANLRKREREEFRRKADQYRRIHFRPASIRAILRKTPEDRTPYEIDALMPVVENSSFFQSIDNPFRKREICRVMSLVTMREGQVLFKEGDKGLAFYLILSGHVALYMKDTHTKVESYSEMIEQPKTTGEILESGQELSLTIRDSQKSHRRESFGQGRNSVAEDVSVLSTSILDSGADGDRSQQPRPASTLRSRIRRASVILRIVSAAVSAIVTMSAPARASGLKSLTLPLGGADSEAEMLEATVEEAMVAGSGAHPHSHAHHPKRQRPTTERGFLSSLLVNAIVPSGEAIRQRFGTCIGILTKGQGFGELALIHSQPRKATAVAASRCVDLITVHKPYYDKTAKRFQEAKLREKAELLLGIEAFSNAPIHDLMKLSLYLKAATFSINEVVLTDDRSMNLHSAVNTEGATDSLGEGEPLIFFIMDGNCRVVCDPVRTNQAAALKKAAEEDVLSRAIAFGVKPHPKDRRREIMTKAFKSRWGTKASHKAKKDDRVSAGFIGESALDFSPVNLSILEEGSCFGSLSLLPSRPETDRHDRVPVAYVASSELRVLLLRQSTLRYVPEHLVRSILAALEGQHSWWSERLFEVLLARKKGDSVGNESVPTATPLSRSHQPREKETGQGDLINIRAKPSSASLRLQPRKKPSAAAGSEKRHCNKEDPIGRSAKKDVVCESGSNEDELFSLDERAKALHNRSWGQEISTEEEVEGGVWVHFESRFGEEMVSPEKIPLSIEPALSIREAVVKGKDVDKLRKINRLHELEKELSRQRELAIAAKTGRTKNMNASAALQRGGSYLRRDSAAATDKRVTIEFSPRRGVVRKEENVAEDTKLIAKLRASASKLEINEGDSLSQSRNSRSKSEKSASSRWLESGLSFPSRPPLPFASGSSLHDAAAPPSQGVTEVPSHRRQDLIDRIRSLSREGSSGFDDYREQDRGSEYDEVLPLSASRTDDAEGFATAYGDGGDSSAEEEEWAILRTAGFYATERPTASNTTSRRCSTAEPSLAGQYSDDEGDGKGAACLQAAQDVSRAFDTAFQNLEDLSSRGSDDGRGTVARLSRTSMDLPTLGELRRFNDGGRTSCATVSAASLVQNHRVEESVQKQEPKLARPSSTPAGRYRHKPQRIHKGPVLASKGLHLKALQSHQSRLRSLARGSPLLAPEDQLLGSASFAFDRERQPSSRSRQGKGKELDPAVLRYRQAARVQATTMLAKSYVY